VETIPAREYSAAYTINNQDRNYRDFATEVLKDYKYVITVGLPCTGKSSFLSAYKNLNGNHTQWCREQIFDMLFMNEGRDEKYNSYIDGLEHDMIPNLLIREHHQVFIDTYGRMKRARSRLLSLKPKGLGKTLALCFDGPNELILDRMIRTEKYSKGMSEADMRLTLDKQSKTAVWPKFSEDFDSIIYINTFGEEGTEYLQYRLINKKP